MKSFLRALPLGALSAVVLGAMIVFAAKPPLWIAGGLVGIFAILHGYAHGVELPATATSRGFHDVSLIVVDCYGP